MTLEEINHQFPIGSKVIVSHYLGCPDNEKVLDETCSAVYVMCGEHMVMLKNKGAYCVENIEKTHE